MLSRYSPAFAPPLADPARQIIKTDNRFDKSCRLSVTLPGVSRMAIQLRGACGSSAAAVYRSGKRIPGFTSDRWHPTTGLFKGQTRQSPDLVRRKHPTYH
jgi:hypothetical protein